MEGVPLRSSINSRCISTAGDVGRKFARGGTDLGTDTDAQRGVCMTTVLKHSTPSSRPGPLRSRRRRSRRASRPSHDHFDPAPLAKVPVFAQAFRELERGDAPKATRVEGVNVLLVRHPELTQDRHEHVVGEISQPGRPRLPLLRASSPLGPVFRILSEAARAAARAVRVRAPSVALGDDAAAPGLFDHVPVSPLPLQAVQEHELRRLLPELFGVEAVGELAVWRELRAVSLFPCRNAARGRPLKHRRHRHWRFVHRGRRGYGASGGGPVVTHSLGALAARGCCRGAPRSGSSRPLAAGQAPHRAQSVSRLGGGSTRAAMSERRERSKSAPPAGDVGVPALFAGQEWQLRGTCQMTPLTQLL